MIYKDEICVDPDTKNEVYKITRDIPLCSLVTADLFEPINDSPKVIDGCLAPNCIKGGLGVEIYIKNRGWVS